MKAEGNQQDYGMRIYDPRIAKFLSVDPMSATFPFYIPCKFAGENPIANINLDGCEPKNKTAPEGVVENDEKGDPWIMHDKEWVRTRSMEEVVNISGNSHRPISKFIEGFYDDGHYEHTVEITRDFVLGLINKASS